MTSHDQDPTTGQIIVDAIEGGLALVELPDGSTVDWPLASLPQGVREGDVVTLHVEGGDLDIEIDHVATRKRREDAQTQLDTLNAGGPTGGIDV